MYKGHENKENDHHFKKLLIVKQILLFGIRKLNKKSVENMNANVRVDKKRYIFINLSVTQICFIYIVKEHFLTILQYCMTSKLTEWQGFWLVTSFIAILTMLWLNHCYGCCWNYLGSSHLIRGYNACFPDFTKLTLCLLATKKEISAIDNSNKWLSGIFERQDQLSLPLLWRTEEQI